MCRLLGVFSVGGVGLEGELGQEQCAKFLSLSKIHSDGWGLAWLEGSRVFRQRDPRSPIQSPCLSQAQSLLAQRTRAAIVHLRMATPGLPRGRDNTHPFLGSGIAFAHNGAILPHKQLRALIPTSTAPAAKGETDSEIYFQLVQQHALDNSDLTDGVCSAIRELRQQFPTASLNALILSSHKLIAVHASTTARNPFDTRDSLANSPPGGTDAYFQMYYRRSADGSLAFASSGIETASWCLMPPDTVGVVDLDTGDLNFHSLTTAGD